MHAVSSTALLTSCLWVPFWSCSKYLKLFHPELGMEAIWKITVEDFPAFILVDDKGNDFFKKF